jgi:exosortase/archaeosortase family protein
MTDSTDERWSLLALATVTLFSLYGRAAVQEKNKRGASEVKATLFPPTLALLTYCAAYAVLPPLARAGLAATALGLTLSALCFGRRLHTGMLGLIYLSLPLIPTLQFYGGYPLRVLVAAAASPLIRLGGFAVLQEGACLNWNGQLIWIDAPCSGVRMLWTGMYLACTLACLYGLRCLKTLLVLALALPAIILGNIFRAVTLFYLEAGIIEMPGWAHDGAGVFAFLIVAGVILAAVRMMRRERVCGELLAT